MKAIGAHFFKELEAASLSGLPFSWSEDGVFCFDESISSQDRAAVLAVFEAHDPATPLSELKSAKNAEINAARAAANTGTFDHAGKTFSCDQLSRGDIDGVNGEVALTGALPQGFPGAWKAVDNTFLPIADVAAWTAFYRAMVAQGAANFIHAQDLKAQLSAATTAEKVAAIVW